MAERESIIGWQREEPMGNQSKQMRLKIFGGHKTHNHDAHNAVCITAL